MDFSRTQFFVKMANAVAHGSSLKSPFEETTVSHATHRRVRFPGSTFYDHTEKLNSAKTRLETLGLRQPMRWDSLGIRCGEIDARSDREAKPFHLRSRTQGRLTSALCQKMS